MSNESEARNHIGNSTSLLQFEFCKKHIPYNAFSNQLWCTSAPYILLLTDMTITNGNFCTNRQFNGP